MVGGGHIDLGWSATPNADFSQISLTHGSYEPWLQGVTPQILRLNGNLYALKRGDDAAAWDASVDHHFVFGPILENAFVATTSTGSHRFSDAQTYAVASVTGTPVVWLSAHSLAVDDTDPDLDGFQAREEYIAGTDPTNTASFFAASITGTNTLTMDWIAASNNVFSISASTNLTTGFAPLTNGLTAAPPTPSALSG